MIPEPIAAGPPLTDSDPLRWLRPCVRALALCACAMALTVGVGYLFDLPVLRSVLPGAVEMKANTALALLLSGVAVFIAAGLRATSSPLAQSSALLVAAIGVATVLEYSFGWNLGIDELLVRDPGGPFAAHPGRMSPYSAVAFCCLGTAMLLQLRGQARALVLLGAFATCVIGLTSLLGYVLDASELTTDQWAPPVALNTAAAFVALGCATLMNARPALLLAAIDAAPFRSRVENKVLAGFAGALLLLCIGGSVSYRMQLNLASATAEAAARLRSFSLIAMLVTLGFATIVLAVLFSSIVRDVRNRARIARELEQAQEEAQRATNAKSEFLAAMSHEIRTPMNGIIGMLDLLQQSSLLEPQRDMVKLTRESADALLAIIDDILDFSKIEAGHLELERAPVCLGEVVEKTCSLLDRLAERRGISLRVFCDPALPAHVWSDATRLRQVLFNLVGNAIKFSSGLTRAGEVSVRAALREAGAQRCVVEFSVADNGIGMSPATLAKLFRSFTQADASTTRRFGGTGLGLAISRRLVQLMGGTIEVQTAEEQGSTFTVRVEFEVAPADGSAPQLADVAGLPCLVLGAQGGVADDIEAYLTAGQARVSRASGLAGIAAWAAAQTPGHAVCLLVSATQMPGVAGILGALPRRRDLQLHVLLVAMGRAQPNPQAEADGIGMLDGNCLTRQSLIASVARAGGRGPATAVAPQRGQRITRLAPRSRDEAILQRRLILVAEDNEINQRVIGEQLNLLGYAVDVAGNGREALRLWRSGDYALLFTDLHMPDMDGYDLALAIRVAEQGGGRTPIVALTANALAGEAQRCHAVGMDDYLTKPAPLSALAATVEKWLPASRQVLAVEAPAPLAEDTLTLDVRIMQDLVGDEPQLTRELLASFESRAQAMGSRLTDAIREQRFRDAADAGHNLKSSAHMVGALPLSRLCQAVEHAAHMLDLPELQALLPRFEAELAAVQRELADALAAAPPARRHSA